MGPVPATDGTAVDSVTGTRIDQDPRPGDRRLDLSVVLATADAKTTIGAQLLALREERWDDGEWEVVILDNGSTDGTAAIIADLTTDDPRFRVVRDDGGAGVAYAKNRGADAAAGSALAFCDADDVITRGWVGAMGRALRTHPYVTGPLLVDELNSEWIRAPRTASTTTDILTFDDIFPFASGCNLGVDGALFDDIGGFDPTVRHGEDIAFAVEVWQRGIPLEHDEGAAIHYRLRPTQLGSFRRAIDYGATRPLIGERLRRAGLPVPDRRRGGRNWLWLVRHLPSLRTRAGRARWLWVLGMRLGNVRGGLAERRLYL